MVNISNRQPSILVADDEEDLLTLINTTLCSEGFKVFISPNGKNIRRLIDENHPDIILLDIRMRGVNGDDICKMLKSSDETKHIPIILFSANHDIERIVEECGADDCLLKPFDKSI